MDMKKVELSNQETDFIKDMISVFLFEHSSIQEVLFDDNENLYTYDRKGNRIEDNYEINCYKLIQSLVSKL